MAVPYTYDDSCDIIEGGILDECSYNVFMASDFYAHLCLLKRNSSDRSPCNLG